MTEDDNDGIPDIDEIGSREKLEAYLLDKPLDWSRQISLRIALRVFPFVLDEFSNSQVHRNLCVQSWRALFISSFADNISDISMRISARAAAKATDAARADAHVTNATTTSSFAASRAASIAATANADTPAANAATNAAKAAAKSADAAARTNPSIWINIRNDLHDLKVVGDIVHHRLFDTENLPSALATKLSDFNKHAHATHPNWIIISQWYQTLLNSNMSKTPWGVLGSKTDIEIALKKGVFWDRDPDVVIAEIAEIIDWDTYDVLENAEPIVLVQALTKMASPEIRMNAEHQLDVQPNQEFDIPNLTEKLATLPQTQVAIADGILDCLPSNAPPIVRSSLNHYREHLAKYGAQPILDILKPFAESLSIAFHGGDADLWNGEFAPLVEHFERNHELLLEHFPRDIERNELITKIVVDEDNALTPQSDELFNALWDYRPSLEEDQHITQAFSDYLRGLEERLDYIRMLPPAKNVNHLEPSALKLYILRTLGVLNNAYTFVASTASIGGLVWTLELQGKLLPLIQFLKGLIV